MRFKKKGPVIRLPKEFRDAVGDNLELAPNQVSLVVYSENEDKRKVIASIKVIIKDLQTELDSAKLTSEV